MKFNSNQDSCFQRCVCDCKIFVHEVTRAIDHSIPTGSKFRQNNFSSSFLLTSMLIPLAFLGRIEEPTPSLFLYCLPQKISCCETSTVITSFGTKELLQTIVGRKYLIGQSFLISFPSIILTLLLFFIAPPADAFLISPMHSLLLLLGGASEIGSHHLSIFLTALFLHFVAPTSLLLLSFFRKLVEMTLLFTSIHTVLLQRNTPLFCCCCCILYLFGNIHRKIFHFRRLRQTPTTSLVIF